MGRLDFQISDYDRPRRLAFDVQGRRMDMRMALTFAPAAAGTTMTFEGELLPKGLMRVLLPIMAPLVRRQMAGRPEQMRKGLAQRAKR